MILAAHYRLLPEPFLFNALWGGFALLVVVAIIAAWPRRK